MSDIECPYCKAENNVCHDDGQGYEEDRRHEMECSHCGNGFVFMTSVLYLYTPYKADCLNGKDHNLKPSPSWPYPDRVECVDCWEQIDGDINPEMLDKLKGDA